MATVDARLVAGGDGSPPTAVITFHAAAHQLSRYCSARWNSIARSSLDEAALGQPAVERFHQVCEILGPSRARIPMTGIATRSWWPRRRSRAAKQLDELAPHCRALAASGQATALPPRSAMILDAWKVLSSSGSRSIYG